MMKRLLFAAVSIILVAALASIAAAQQPVDLRVNLSTQPVYGGYAPTPSYFGLSDLYSSGNVRWGMAFRGHRNFLEDRYFSGSLSRFYRDTVGSSDVVGGVGYGLAQPFYAPGSLGVTGSSVSPVRASTPYGLSFNPNTTLPSPYGMTMIVRTEPLEPSPAQFPTLTAMQSMLQRMTVPEAAEETRLESTPLWAPLARMPALPETDRPQLPETSRLDLRLLPRETEEGLEGAEGEQPPLEGVRPLDFLRRQQDAETARTDIETGQPPVPKGQPFLFEEDTEQDAQDDAAGEITLPEIKDGVAGRPQKLDEQYMALADLEMAAGAYRPAADAYQKVTAFNPLRRWEAGRGEAFARLLAREYFLAAYLLKYTIVAKPDQLRKDFRLADVVNRPEDWQAVEKDVAAQLEKTPGSPDYAFVMTCLKVFSGKPAEAESYLKSLADHEDYGEAVRLLREKALP